MLGGGGVLGAHEVGMLQALLERSIVPDVVVGTSIGAVNGAHFAATPTAEGVEQLGDLWRTLRSAEVFGDGLGDRLRLLARSMTHLLRDEPLRELLEGAYPVRTFAELELPFQCVASCVETASAHYFTDGPLVDAVMASCAIPGLLPPVEIDGRHYLDGGLVASIPLDRAIALGATTIYVLQVGRIEEPLVPPSKPWEVAAVAFEISRRHRFSEAMAALPDGVDVHVLPTGEPKAYNDFSQYRSQTSAVDDRIRVSYEASVRYLDELAGASS